MAKKKSARTWRHELAEFVAGRYSLNFVYHQGNRYIASDGKRLAAVIPAEKPAAAPEFLDANAFPTHDAVIQAADCRYPNVDAVIPDTDKADRVATWGADDLEQNLALATAVTECQRHDTEHTSLLLYTVGASGPAVPSVRIGSQFFGRAECHAKTGPWEWGLDARFVRDVLRLIAARKGENITVEFHGKGDSPVVWRWEAGGSKELALIMPLDLT